MRFPYEKWLKYLIQFSDFSQDDIIAAADGFGFPVPTKVYLTFLRKDMAQSKPKPFRKGSKKYTRWIREEGLWGMYNRAPDVVQAKRLLGQVRVRQTVEYLLVANTPAEDIVGYVEDSVGVVLSVGVVEAYSHYFCNMNLLTAKQWLSYFKKFGEEGRTLTDCFYLRSPEFSLWKLGYRVSLNRDAVMQTIFHEAVMRFTETTRFHNGLKTAQTGKIWSEVIFDADDRMQGAADSVRAILDELKEIRIKLGRRDISSLEELRE